MSVYDELELLKQHALLCIEAMDQAREAIETAKKQMRELQDQNQEQSQRIADLERLLAEARNVSDQA